MNTYVIQDIVGYADETRNFCVSHLKNKNSDNKYSNENLDEYITINEIISLVMKRCCGFDENNRAMITKSIHENIFEDICDWIYGIGLSKLASKDLIECAWDDDENCMVFWIKQENNDGKTN